MAQILVDTNVLVYAYDASEPVKQPRAAELLDMLQALNIGALSVQNLNEFFAVAVRKFDPPMSVPDAAAQVALFTQTWAILDLTPAIVLEAMRGVGFHQMAFWDALVWAAAKLNQIPVILTEDFQHDQVVEGVRFIDPFRPGFSINVVQSLLR